MVKRIRKPKNDGRVLYKKVGGGSFRLENRIIKPNQTFYAYPYEIPEAFKDVVLPMEEFEPPKVMVVDFHLEPIPDTDTFNIVDGDGKVLNEQPLTKEVAEEALAKLV